MKSTQYLHYKKKFENKTRHKRTNEKKIEREKSLLNYTHWVKRSREREKNRFVEPWFIPKWWSFLFEWKRKSEKIMKKKTTTVSENHTNDPTNHYDIFNLNRVQMIRGGLSKVKGSSLFLSHHSINTQHQKRRNNSSGCDDENLTKITISYKMSIAF